MPLLDIATSQPSFRNHFCTSRLQTLLHGSTSVTLAFRKEKRLSSAWGVPIQIPRKVNFDMGHLKMRGTLLIKAVATLERKYLVEREGPMNGMKSPLGHDLNHEGSQDPNEDSAETNEREKLRRKRISKANKGNVPWNKGRKHSPETLQRIRERTRQAMQDPKIKMKLVNFGHAQSEETREKISLGVRMGWQRRRERLMVQENCNIEWQDLIAEASRIGYSAEEELQWNSYEVLDEQLQQEWLESVKQRKSEPKPIGGKRAPKSPEQRRKISEAIAAKWADPAYRERVCGGLSKFHGTTAGASKRPKRKPRDDTQPRTSRKKANEDRSSRESKNQARSRLRKRLPAPYKDPLADTKFEMLRSIRAERVATETKKIEAMERAKLLIVEAEKAAKALEVAATKSRVALDSLIETRRLIAEATSFIQAAEAGHDSSHVVDKNNSSPISEMFSEQDDGHLEDDEEQDTESEDLSLSDKVKVNGTHVRSSSNIQNSDFDFSKFPMQSLLNSEEEPIEIGPRDSFADQLQLNSLFNHRDPEDEQSNTVGANGVFNYQRITELNGEATQVQSEKTETSNTDNSTKKRWIRGRLVEVTDED